MVTQVQRVRVVPGVPSPARQQSSYIIRSSSWHSGLGMHSAEHSKRPQLDNLRQKNDIYWDEAAAGRNVVAVLIKRMNSLFT